jgi:hypothetical protein
MRKLCIPVFMVLCLLAGCGLLPAAQLAPEQIVSKSVERLKGLAGFHFSIAISGNPVYIDSGKTTEFSKVDGNFVAPNQASVVVKVAAMGMTTEVKIIGIGEKSWQTNPLSGQWGEMASGTGFNPASLFDQTIGLQKILLEDLSDIKLAGQEELKELPGKKMDVITAKMKGENVKKLTNGMISADTTDIKLWVDPSTFDINRLLIVVPGKESGQSSNWQFDIWDFGKTITIAAPTGQ